MKNSKLFFCAVSLLTMALPVAPLRAQYNPPPPPDQQSTGEMNPPPADDQAGPPPGDEGSVPPDPNAPPPDQGQGDANFQTFYDNLSSQGSWVQTDNYGYVWQPNVNDPDWAPYTNGHWVYTDEGWTWLADDSEPWGWATYHYGRWVNLDGTGWVWVPGYTWAPAWVSWRYGGGYCGWAPLPPTTFVGIDFGRPGFGFHIGGDCDPPYNIGPAYYRFLPVGYLGERNYHNYYVNRYNNYTIINNTRNVTNIMVNSQSGSGQFGRVHVGGPSLAEVNVQARTPVPQMTLTRSGQIGNAQADGNRLNVFAPRIEPAKEGQLRPRALAGHLADARVNNGTDINRFPAANERLRPAGPDAAQVQAAQAATVRAPAAHVATIHTRPTQDLTQPLTRLQPHLEAGVAPAGAAFVSRPAGPASAAGGRSENAFTGENAVRENAVHENTIDENAARQNAINENAARETAARERAARANEINQDALRGDEARHPATGQTQAEAPVRHFSEPGGSAPAFSQHEVRPAMSEPPRETAPVFHEQPIKPHEEFHPQAPTPHFNAPAQPEVRPQIQPPARPQVQQERAAAPENHAGPGGPHGDGKKKDDDRK